MFAQGQHSSDVESDYSETSDVTSRATTITDSWSDTTFQQQQSNRSNNQVNGRDQSVSPLTSTASDSTVIQKTPDTQRANNNQSNQVNAQNQQQQQSWVNPYWNSNRQPSSATSQSGTNQISNNTDIGDSSSAANLKQLIPGSIMINDQGEIDDLSWQQNGHLDSSTSTNSFKPGGKYISDDSGGPGGYLVPTHTQSRNFTSSSGSTARKEDQYGYKQSDSTSGADTTQSWINPYWSQSNQNQNLQPTNTSKQTSQTKSNTGTASPDKLTSSDNAWENPYWKDKTPQTPQTSKQETQSWENPYWKDKKPQTSQTSKQEDQAWKNPYWKDAQVQAPTTFNQEQEKSQQKSFRKDKSSSNQDTNNTGWNTSLSSHSNVPPVPSFYERLYPPYPSQSSPVPTTHTQQETAFSAGSSKQINDDKDDLPYTIDNQGVAHYRGTSSSTSGTNKTVNFSSTPKPSQYPVSPPQKPSVPPTPQVSNATSLPQTTTAPPPLLSNLNNYPSAPRSFPNPNSYPSSFFNYLSSTSSPTVLTVDDLNTIQNALRLAEINPHAIPVIETPNQFQSSNINDNNNSPSALAALFGTYQGKQPRQQSPPPPPPSSSFSQNQQFNSTPYPYNSNSQQSALFSTPSYPPSSTPNPNEPSGELIPQGHVFLI